MNQKIYASLHNHSYYSILEAGMSVQDLIDVSEAKGVKYLGLTDTGAGYGLIEFAEKAAKNENINPLFGCEMALSGVSRFEKRPGIDGQEGGIVLLAKNDAGYENLLYLISQGWLEGYFEQPRIDWELLEVHNEGLICLTGSSRGFLGKMHELNQIDKAEESLKRLKKVFGNDLYIELVSREGENQREVNIWKKALSEKFEVPFVITTDSRFVSNDDQIVVEIMDCIEQGETLDSPHRNVWMNGASFKSWEEIERELGYLDKDVLEEARLNTLKIADQIDFAIEFDKSLLPEYEVPDGYNEATWLRQKCTDAIERRYDLVNGEIKRPEIEERLDYELSIISKMGFDAYFLITADFIEYAKREGIFVGPGRGSAAGAIVAFLLEITNVDPLYYELLFERFLNPERISMPDIDIDFSDERRHEVLDYVTKMYGSDKVSKVATFGTFAAKAAIKDTGRAYGVDFSQMNRMTKLLPAKPGFELSEAEEIKEFMSFIGSSRELTQVFESAKKLEGAVRHVSVHACAVIIGKFNLTKDAPLQWAQGAEEVKISQYPYQQLEHLGLLKMDFLGLKNLSILERALGHIKDMTGEEINLEDIPLDDAKTFEMISRGETTGVFQFESAGMRRYLKELQPTEFEDLVAMNALYRPGPMMYIPDYINGKHDPTSVKYMHKALEPILRKTYGIAVYQEQVLRIAQDFAGFSLGQADILRKAIGKKIVSILAEQREKFSEGAVAKGYTKKDADKIFDEVIVPFSGYGFNRSHAVCYARIAYETAYLRAHYPEEFMAAMMTNDRNVTERIVMEMNECVQMGIEVLPPSINSSDSFFTVVKEDGVKKIRFGLTGIKGLGEEPSDVFIKERTRGGKFKSLQDFVTRVPAKLINKKSLEALAFSGGLDEYAGRGSIVAGIDSLTALAKENKEKQEVGQMDLFGDMLDEEVSFELPFVEATKADILKWEKDSMGLYVSDHPLRGLEQYFVEYGEAIGTLEEEDIGKNIVIHGLVVMNRKIMTKKGLNMAIFGIEDTSGKIEAVAFPKSYDAVPKEAFEDEAFVKVRGKLESRDGSFNLIIDSMEVGDLSKIKDFKQLFAPEVEEVVIEIPDGTPKNKVDEIKSLIIEYKSTDDKACDAFVLVGGKKVALPFMVLPNPKLFQSLEKILAEGEEVMEF